MFLSLFDSVAFTRSHASYRYHSPFVSNLLPLSRLLWYSLCRLRPSLFRHYFKRYFPYLSSNKVLPAVARLLLPAEKHLLRCMFHPASWMTCLQFKSFNKQPVSNTNTTSLYRIFNRTEFQGKSVAISFNLLHTFAIKADKIRSWYRVSARQSFLLKQDLFLIYLNMLSIWFK